MSFEKSSPPRRGSYNPKIPLMMSVPACRIIVGLRLLRQSAIAP
jgi:hypothetical protein